MTELIGKTLGNYRMDRLLGEGGMGSVYQAYDLALQREVAIKLIHPHLARREDFRERFIQEARMMARLDHPGIVRVYVLGREGDLLFLPMEFIKGGNLRQLLDRLIQEKKWLPLNEALLLVKQLCQVVDYAHRHGVLHRDIKPANLMLKPEPTDGLPFRVILTDLGLAKLLEGLGITQEGTSLGTPAYMSPEQASGRPTDPRSDVYSLGILLYELAVGRLPFAIRSITEATRYHNQVPPPTPRSIRPDLPEALERVILKALEKEPDKRYASAAGLAEVLSGSLSFATEIIDRANQDSASLVTEYQASMVAAPGPAAASLMTFLGSEPVGPRGSSVFGDQSIAPSSQTRIQIVHKEHTAKTLTLPAGTITIGRGKDNHIVLDDDRVSRRHAQITWDGLEYHVMDLNSSNGTYLENAKLLAGMSEIFRPGQNLRIGDTWLRLIPPATQTSGASQTRSMAGGSPGFAHSSAGLVGVSVEPKQLTVEAGGSATITLSLLNQSPNVDHFSISLTGIPADWVTSLPAGVQLMPKEQKEAAFDLHVPRSPQSQAGPHPIKIKVTSQRDPSESVEVKLVLTVAGYSQFISELEPQKIRSGQTARLIVSNQGNLQEVFSIQFKDAANELAFQPPQIQMRVPAGETAAAEFQVQEKQRRWMGSERSHPFNTKVSLPKGETQTLQAEMVSRGLVPVWLPPVVLLLCLALAGAAGLIIGPGQASRQATQTAMLLMGDPDGDGLLTSEESAYGCRPDNPDTDNDGLWDGDERAYATGCTVLDSDGDTLFDGVEVHQRHTSPINTDTDGDGLQDNTDPDPGTFPSPTPIPPIMPTASVTAPGFPTPDLTQTAIAVSAASQADADKTATAQRMTAEASAFNATQTAIRATETQNAINAAGTLDAVNATNTQQARNATETEQAMACFIGNWVPTEPSTGENDFARLRIDRVNQSTYTYQGFGNCTPNECDWGLIEIPFSSPQLVGTFRLDRRTVRITVQCTDNNQLLAEVFDERIIMFPLPFGSSREVPVSSTLNHILKRRFVFDFPGDVIIPDLTAVIQP